MADRPTTGPWLSTEDAAAYLGLSNRRALQEMVRRGTVKAYRLGNKLLRFSQPELDDMLTRSPTCRTSNATD